MIDKLMMSVGAFFLLVGGALLLAAVLALFAWLVGSAWIATSNKWRRICQAESLIFEYRKNREEYMEWKKEQEEQHG